ncbi:MAG TPA: hypothetical protein VIE36_09365 [Methylomirabilota bacterium]|jgi:hypothetical protein
MWMDIDPEAAVVRCRIADAYREAELRGLARQAKSANHVDTQGPALMLRIVRAASRLWPKRRIETTVLP